MKEQKLTFEILPDKTCVITVIGKNMHGESFIRQSIIDQQSVFDAIKEQIESISAEVERRVEERLPSEEESYKWADDMFGCSGTQAPLCKREVAIAMRAIKWIRSRMTEGGGK